jgi:NAD(P)-dependent dehydrogenase (short-subunit alcohol dehydrogenase family)
MKDKICLVTGSTSGTGYITALELAKAGATVVMLCRNEAKGKTAQHSIIQSSGNERVDLLIADLAEMQDVRRAAMQLNSKYPKLDVLVNNAGGIIYPRRETSQGLEATFAGNYLGHFLLTELLLDKLKSAGQARIINVSSIAHNNARINFDDLQLKSNLSGAYGQSKLAQIFHTYELADRLRGSGITVNAMHPGAVSSGFKNGVTGFRRAIAYAVYALIGISPEKGADTIVYLATSPEVADVTGKYFIKRKDVPSKGISYDVALRKRLWAETEALLRSLEHAVAKRA